MNEDQEFLLKLRGEFFSEAHDLVNDCQGILENMSSQNWDDFLAIYMANLHNLKGSSQAAEYDSFSKIIHMMEDMRDDNISNDLFKEVSLKMLGALIRQIEKMRLGEEKAVNILFEKILSTKRQ
ncbi:MAG: hypothetical protein KAG61_11730 [Bacteriovoracaceae bacterium]|nr:hypothetical protein [Bacteriovoracaceae bacterium]